MAGDPLPRAVRARLDDLAGRWALDAVARDRLAGLLELLGRIDHASTTVRDPAEAVDVHVADALCGLDLPVVRDAGTIADLGAGAGFPGLVLAIALPHARVHLVESVARRLAFPEVVAAELGLANVLPTPVRAEDWGAAEGAGSCDVVTARALAPLGVLAEYAAPLLREGGSLVAWKAAVGAEEQRAAEVACADLGLGGPEEHPVRPWPPARMHRLVQVRKIAPTPGRFPRRAGMARKRPLGA